ncbi:WD40 repeat domain-containing protein [Catellatospora tritici]|uniref:WD40 repeat domain-containing protein n=1 Tax=Catellatospora tritici TaxID=2851566 RepID=UPI001C2CF5BF|nr:WD40 repeat domain-containing protein [Catellatospora tritici]MBV1848890.1 PQQ-binding-like beta-propeller repeat protein [Catellatospora tritici]
MELAGGSGPPFLEVDRIISFCGLHTTQVAGRSVLVLGTMRFRDAVELYDAADGSPINSIDVGSRETNYGNLRTLLLPYPEQPLLLGGFSYRPIHVWQIPDGEVVAQWKAPGPWEAATVHEQGSVTTVAMAVEGTVRQLDAFTGREAGERLHAREGKSLFRRNTSELWSVASSGPYLLAGSSSGDVWQWDAGSGDVVAVWKEAHSGPVLRMTAHEVAGRPVLATMGSDQAVRVWDVSDGTQLGEDVWLSFDMPRPAFAAGGRLLIAGDHELKQVDVLTGERGPVLARWEQPNPERTEFDYAIEEIAVGDMAGVEVVFAASTAAVWRLDAATGEPV